MEERWGSANLCLPVTHPDDFAAWLAAHGGDARESWHLGHKKASGKQTLTHAQPVEVALWHGWIDGLRKSLDTER